jgi:hypothetical protein
MQGNPRLRIRKDGVQQGLSNAPATRRAVHKQCAQLPSIRGRKSDHVITFVHDDVRLHEGRQYHIVFFQWRKVRNAAFEFQLLPLGIAVDAANRSEVGGLIWPYHAATHSAPGSSPPAVKVLRLAIMPGTDAASQARSGKIIDSAPRAIGSSRSGRGREHYRSVAQLAEVGDADRRQMPCRRSPAASSMWTKIRPEFTTLNSEHRRLPPGSGSLMRLGAWTAARRSLTPFSRATGQWGQAPIIRKPDSRPHEGT